jgi:hypothetical protein
VPSKMVKVRLYGLTRTFASTLSVASRDFSVLSPPVQPVVGTVGMAIRGQLLEDRPPRCSRRRDLQRLLQVTATDTSIPYAVAKCHGDRRQGGCCPTRGERAADSPAHRRRCASGAPGGGTSARRGGRYPAVAARGSPDVPADRMGVHQPALQ